jgi:serine/threonine protein kinase
MVFAAEDATTGERVALKILHENIADDPQYAVRLRREAESLQMLWDESVVRVQGFGHDAQGSVYMVMELLEGETLSEHLADLESYGDRMSAFEVLRRLDPIARALHTAHSKGLIHRDVKPANIFCIADDRGGGVRLMDFGLVKIAGAEALTQVGMVAGSPSYVAPELWLGEPFDHRLDVYSFAAVVFRCLAGQTPFSGANPLELFLKVTKEPRPKLSAFRRDLHPDIDGWVARALSVERDKRYPYVSTMWNDFLRIVMAGTTPSAQRARATFRLPG